VSETAALAQCGRKEAKDGEIKDKESFPYRSKISYLSFQVQTLLHNSIVQRLGISSKLRRKRV